VRDVWNSGFKWKVISTKHRVTKEDSLKFVSCKQDTVFPFSDNVSAALPKTGDTKMRPKVKFEVINLLPKEYLVQSPLIPS
jgi:hypothetical protein